MKNRKTLLPKIVILSGMVLAGIVNLFLCAAEKPAVTRQSFPFSITYEFGGKTVTIEDEYVCTYTGPGQSVDPKDRFYDGVFAKNRDELLCGDYRIRTYEDGELVVFTNLFAGHMMGDPLYEDHYNDYYRREPYIAFYDYDEYVEYADEETLAAYDARILRWDYPEPMENTFVFAGFTRLTPGNVLPMAAVSLLTLFACIFLVKKEPGLTCGRADRVSVILNYGIGLAVLPFLTIVCPLTDINGGGADLLSQITFCVPAITGFGLAASVCLRRKGFGKASLLVQFVGIAVMALVVAGDIFV